MTAKVTHIGKAIPESWRGPTFPKELGACIDLLIKAKKRRKAAEEVVKTAELEEERIEEYLIKTFEKQKIDGAKGKLGSVALKHKDVPRITDYDAFCRYVEKTGSWDLFTKRAHETASQSRWESGVEIPGVERYHKLDLIVTVGK